MRIVLLVLLLFLLVAAGCSGPGKYNAFAQCLTEKGAVMYGTEWCSHCQNQKKDFGKSFQYIRYIDCDESKEDCQDAGISGYPTWVINGTKYPGEQELFRLASLIGCELAEESE